MERWNGRVALVTGASVGIGASICKKLVKHGMIVVGCDRTVEGIQALASDEEISEGPGKYHAIKCDMAQESEIMAMFAEIRKKFDRVDVCINNAGLAIDSTLASGKAEEWRNMLEVNVVGMCICTRESLTLMKEKDIHDGQIVQMGSIFGHRMPIVSKNSQAPCYGIYNGTKFMVRALAEALRQELKINDSYIKVATISLGAVEGEVARTLGLDELETSFGSAMYLKSEDIADAVTFVLSAPNYVNVEDVIVQPIDFSV